MFLPEGVNLNIFYLDHDVDKCARYHCDKHVVKMIVEYTQILSSVYYFTGESNLAPYKLTHANHPCCRWARASLSNWLWLRKLALSLCKEYTFRYGKIHKCEEILKNMKPPSLIDRGFTNIICVMDDEYIKGSDAVENYRNLYRYGKRHLLSYKGREMPEWLLED